MENALAHPVAAVHFAQDQMEPVLAGAVRPQLLVDGRHALHPLVPAPGRLFRLAAAIPVDLFEVGHGLRSPDQLILGVEQPDPGPHQLVHAGQVVTQNGLIHVQGIEIPHHHGHLAALVVQFDLLGAEEIIGDQITEPDGNAYDDSQNQAHVTVHEPGA